MALGFNSDVTGLNANRNLLQATRKTNSALEKLSSGLRINKGKDNPADLIISELLRSQISGYERALRNTQETNNVMSIAEGGLSSVSSMLTKMKSLAVHSMNDGITSQYQTSANQAELNSLLSSINRVVNTTSYAGNQLLNGAQGFTFNTSDPSSIIDSGRTSISSVNGTSSGNVSVDFAGAAAPAQAASVEGDLSGLIGADGNLLASLALDINGQSLSIAAGTSVEGVAEAINANAALSSDLTAYAVRNDAGQVTGIRLDSNQAGSAAAITTNDAVFGSGAVAGADAATGAAQAERAYLEADFGASTLSQAQEFTITGADGARTFSFSAGTSIAEMADTINNLSGSTGVNAYAIRNEGTGETALRLVSTEYGSDQSVRVDQLTGNAFAQQGRNAVDYGQDATLSINGEATTTRGLTAEFATAGGIRGQTTFNAGDPGATTIAQTGYDQDNLTNATAAQSAQINNVKGGMQLQLGGNAGGQNRETISIGNYNPSELGRVVVDGQAYSLNDLYSGGSASLANNPEIAMRVIEQAISDVSSGRANIGAYQANTLDTNANNLMVGIENLTATESDIRDADMAEMMTQFIAAKLLQDTNIFGIQSSNQNRRNVMQLLAGGIGR